MANVTWNDVFALVLRILRRWWIITLIVALVGGAAAWRLSEASDRYETTTLMVVGPNTDLEPTDVLRVAGLLGSNMVMATYADVMASPRVVSEAKSSITSTPRSAWDADYSVRVVQEPDSNVLRMIVEGPDPDVTVALAAAVMARGQVVLGDLFPIYSVVPLSTDEPRAELVNLPWARALGLALAIGLALGMFVALWFDALLEYRRESRATVGARNVGATADMVPVEAQAAVVSRQ